MAILTTETFDALTVDPLSVTLAGAPVKLKGRETPMAPAEDVNADGLPDLVVHIENEKLQLKERDQEAVLKGKTYRGIPVQGADSIQVVPSGTVSIFTALCLTFFNSKPALSESRMVEPVMLKRLESSTRDGNRRASCAEPLARKLHKRFDPRHPCKPAGKNQVEPRWPTPCFLPADHADQVAVNTRSV